MDTDIFFLKLAGVLILLAIIIYTLIISMDLDMDLYVQ